MCRVSFEASHQIGPIYWLYVRLLVPIVHEYHCPYYLVIEVFVYSALVEGLRGGVKAFLLVFYHPTCLWRVQIQYFEFEIEFEFVWGFEIWGVTSPHLCGQLISRAERSGWDATNTRQGSRVKFAQMVLIQKVVVHRKYFRYRHKTSADVLIVLPVIGWAEFHITSMIIDRFLLFIHVIYVFPLLAG